MSKRRVGLLTLLAVAVAVAVAVASGALSGSRDLPRTDGPITDPIPEKPIVSGLALTLQEFVTMPRSDPPPIDDPRVQRWARINFLGEVPDRSGRLFVPDLNGKMYLIENGKPQQVTVREYLNVAAEFSPDFWSEFGLQSGFGFVTSTRASRRTAACTRSTPRHARRLRERLHACQPSTLRSLTAC